MILTVEGGGGKESNMREEFPFPASGDFGTEGGEEEGEE